MVESVTPDLKSLLKKVDVETLKSISLEIHPVKMQSREKSPTKTI